MLITALLLLSVLPYWQDMQVTSVNAETRRTEVVWFASREDALARSIRLSRQAVRTARENVAFALAVKAAVILLGLLGRPSLWLAVFADSGVAMLCVCNAVRVLLQRRRRG